jgi:hypothetical protein
MTDEVGSNALFPGAGRRRYLQIIVTAAVLLTVLGLVAARVRPVITYKYVSRINQGQLQVCRVTPVGEICPPLSASLSKSYSPSKSYSESGSASASKSKSYSSSNSLSTSTSLSPSVHSQ